jgi:hypothetical protein
MKTLPCARWTLSLVVVGMVFAAGHAFAWSAGPPDGYCGNPPSMVTCEACHINEPGDGSLTMSGLPAGGYTPGAQYHLTVILQDPGQRRWGFELTALETAAFTQAGTFTVTDPVNTQLSNNPGSNPDFMKHTSTGTHNGLLDGPVSWNFDWTAPMSGNLVTFYIAGNAANGNGNNSGDYIYTHQPAVAAATTGIADATPALMLVRPSFPNPAPAGVLAELQFSLDRPAHVVLRVVDAQGRFVAEPFGAELPAGFHQVAWNGLTMAGAPAPRGLYFLSLQAGGKNLISRRIVD